MISYDINRWGPDENREIDPEATEPCCIWTIYYGGSRFTDKEIYDKAAVYFREKHPDVTVERIRGEDEEQIEYKTVKAVGVWNDDGKVEYCGLPKVGVAEYYGMGGLLAWLHRNEPGLKVLS